MNLVRILHETAMEYGDLARMAAAKGQPELSKEFYARAFELERDAACQAPLQQEDPVPRHILLRSAASLAMMSGNREEARKLVAAGLSANPPDFIEEELQELSRLMQQQEAAAPGKKETMLISGILTYANASQNEIKIQDAAKRLIYTLIAPDSLIKKLVRQHFLASVSVEAALQPHGVMVAQRIRNAA